MRLKEYTEQDKGNFLAAMKKHGGIVGAACDEAGVTYYAYRCWLKEDADFARAVEDISDMQCDAVESKLMQLINAGDTTAIIFYLKTKGKKRGWSEKFATREQAAALHLPDGGQGKTAVQPDAVETGKAERLIKSRRSLIVRTLKKEGKYTRELDLQIDITAQLLVKTETLYREVSAATHQAVTVEISREGNGRETISPREKLYLDYVQQSQRALRALGMNTDSKERRTDNDTFGDFLKEFKEE